MEQIQHVFKEVDEARYNEMLGVMWPVFWTDKGFLVGEQHERKIIDRLAASFTAFVCHRGKFYESVEVMTVPEFKAFDPNTL